MKPRLLLVLVLAVSAIGAEEHWHSGDRGTGVDEILASWPLREPEPVVVAVLDSGFDIDHPALAPALWTNAGEATGEAGADDDGNGFIDDRHGWSFLCSRTGEPLVSARMEVTRLYARYAAEVEAGERSADDPQWRTVAAAFEAERDTWRNRLYHLYLLDAIRSRALADLRAAGIDVDDPEALAAAQPEDWLARAALAALRGHASGPMAERVEDLVAESRRRLEVCYNPDFEESAILGDDPDDPAPEGYGGPQLSIGWRDTHGTMVAGIIGGIPWEEGGTHGLAPAVRLMLLRTTPSGDERDKDVAAGVRYAVANGARIINLSFGKPFSPQKAWVDAAMREAEAAGVLVVHAAGNDGHEVHPDTIFPTPTHADGRFTNWLVVGASRDHEDPVTRFSNWSPREVDLFAPGAAIRAPSGDGGVATEDGTSFAAPCVSGVAALLWSQFPTATVDQIRTAILTGVRIPQQPERLAERCASGGLLDARLALAALARAMDDESILPEHLRSGVPE